MTQRLLKLFLKDDKKVSPAAFVLNMALIYLVWKLLSGYARMTDSPLHPFWRSLNDSVASLLSHSTAFVLNNLLGYDAIANSRNIFIQGSKGIYVADHCLGIAPCVIFTGFVLAYDGSWKHKLWFIPLGIAGVLAINAFRLILLSLTQKHFSQWYFHIGHSYLYLGLSYGLIFLLVMWWMNRLSHLK